MVTVWYCHELEPSLTAEYIQLVAAGRVKGYIISWVLFLLLDFNVLVAWGQTNPDGPFCLGDLIGIGKWRIEKQKLQHCCITSLRTLDLRSDWMSSTFTMTGSMSVKSLSSWGWNWRLSTENSDEHPRTAYSPGRLRGSEIELERGQVGLLPTDPTDPEPSARKAENSCQALFNPRCYWF